VAIFAARKRRRKEGIVKREANKKNKKIKFAKVKKVLTFALPKERDAK
jgi:hypothetical protein